jgi:16S rRNA (cytosine967-C5)-methyltransferase
VAVDVHAGRLSLVESLSARLGLANVRTLVSDARGIGALGLAAFDRVLVDAPCTGLGVLRRNPDARWRVKPDAPERLAGLQREILAAAIGALRPGGVLVYGVCTFTPEETVAVTADLLAAHGEVVLEGAGKALGVGFGEVVSREPAAVLRTWPHRHRTVGFAARFRRTG